MLSSYVTQKAQFEYAWCLVRSKYSADIRKGILLLEDLYSKHGDSEKRDCLYYLAVGNARLKVRCIRYIMQKYRYQILYLQNLQDLSLSYLFIGIYEGIVVC